MIRLRRARFTNFRLLRDVEITFSTDPDRRLTVIRADNESGKTTALRGLLWALFGDDALPGGGGSDFRLHPIDMQVDRPTHVPISVEVVFDVVASVPMGGSPIVETYRLTRATSEEIFPGRNDFRRARTTLAVVKVTDQGDRPEEHPEVFLDARFPGALRDVFFTDGDRTLTFIEASATTSARRQRVEKAIRSLLGLDILEMAIKHVEQVKSDFANEAGKSGPPGSTQNTLKEQLLRLSEQRDRLAAERDQAATTVTVTDEELAETQKQIEGAIAKGGADQEALVRRKAEIAARVRVMRARLADLRKQQAQMAGDSSIAFLLIGDSLKNAIGSLSTLHNRGEIPKNFKSLLEERLELGECICGSSLADGTALRGHLVEVLRKQGEQDAVRGHLLELLYTARPWITDEARGRWIHRLEGIYRDFAGVQRDLKGAEQDLASIQLRLDQIGATDLPRLRTSEQALKGRNREARDTVTTAELRLRQMGEMLTSLNRALDSALKADEKGKAILARRTVAEDLLSVLRSTLNGIKTGKVDEVSRVTNELFLKMIKADPEASVIRMCTVTRDFDILVYGPHHKALNPDQDLNGASRRALTLAFVMALTRVSGVDAPLVIDTPLGMMGPEIKREVLKVAVENSSQLVLFLTRAEIRDIEPQLDACGGTFHTISNSSHFPAMLRHAPKVAGLQSMVCDCSHRETCHVCERRDDDAELSEGAA